MGGIKWTEKEDEYIIANAGSKSDLAMSLALGRTVKAVESRRYGLAKEKKLKKSALKDETRAVCKGCVWFRKYSGLDSYGCHLAAYNNKTRMNANKEFVRTKEFCPHKETDGKVFERALMRTKNPYMTRPEEGEEDVELYDRNDGRRSTWSLYRFDNYSC